MTGLRGASLDWDSGTAGNARRTQVAGNTAGLSQALIAVASAAVERREARAPEARAEWQHLVRVARGRIR